MELWPAIMAPRAFQFLETAPRCYEPSKLRQAGSTDRLNGGWAGCHDRFFIRAAGWRENVSLDSPFHRTSTNPKFQTQRCVCGDRCLTAPRSGETPHGVVARYLKAFVALLRERDWNGYWPAPQFSTTLSGVSPASRRSRFTRKRCPLADAA
jgi:hypothetical protein